MKCLEKFKYLPSQLKFQVANCPCQILIQWCVLVLIKIKKATSTLMETAEVLRSNMHKLRLAFHWSGKILLTCKENPRLTSLKIMIPIRRPCSHSIRQIHLGNHPTVLPLVLPSSHPCIGKAHLHLLCKTIWVSNHCLATSWTVQREKH